MDAIEDAIASIESGHIVEYRNVNVELKRSWQQDHGKKISFLANKNTTIRSWLIIGLEDDGTYAGKDESWAKQTEETMSQHLNQYLDPIQAVSLFKCWQSAKGEWLVFLRIENPGVVVRWNTNAFIGSGTTLREMTPDEVMSLTIQLPGLSDYSSQAGTSEYDQGLLAKFLGLVRGKHTSNIFGSIAVADIPEALSRLKLNQTNASRILFGQTPFRVVNYGADGEIAKNETRYGVFQLVEDAMLEEISAQLRKHNKAVRIPTRAIREGIANAVAHASYFENNGEITLEIYPSRLIISNLCLPESGYFANKWFSRSHKTVNNLLMETLRIAGIVDELGRGKNLIYSESLRNGNLPPSVLIEKASRFNRWKLCIFFQSLDQKNTLMLQRLKALYKDDSKTLIANALVLWRDKKVSEIREYIDDESFPLVSEVLRDFNGPVFYYEKDDSLNLRRWAGIILEKGALSKSFSLAEEESLLRYTYDYCTKFESGIITSKEFRELARMGNSNSEITLGSNMLTKWKNLGILQKMKKGTYQFVRVPETDTIEQNLEVLRQRLFSPKYWNLTNRWSCRLKWSSFSYGFRR